MNIVIMGPPGSGKGTQSNILVDAFDNFYVLSMGNILRHDMQKNAAINKELGALIGKGLLVDDGKIISLAEKKIIENIDKNIIFDGIPRTIQQAQALLDILEKYNKSLDCLINIDVDENILSERLMNRLICQKCNATYNVNFVNISNGCKKCGALTLTKRDDDNNDAIYKRIKISKNYIDIIVKYYHTKRIKLIFVNGNGSMAEVTKNIHSKLNL